MKKIKLSIGILAFVGLAVLNFTKSETTFVQKAMASSACYSFCNSSCTCGCMSSNPSTAPNIDHTGGLANKFCPIWNVSFTTNVGTSSSISVTCSTRGEWQCEKGTCPHGYSGT